VRRFRRGSVIYREADRSTWVTVLRKRPAFRKALSHF